MKNHMISDRFKELVNDYYTKPTDEEISGSFLSIISDDPPVRTQKTLSSQREKKKQSTPEINVPGIKEMFRRQAENGQRNEQTGKKMICN